MARQRDTSIESLRGLAVILMVAGHVIGSDGQRGLQVGDSSAWRLSYLLLEDVRMPLFTVLSGFVYAHRGVVGLQSFRRLIWGKGRRLLVPLVTIGTILFGSQLLIPGVNHRPNPTEWWRVYVFGYEHLWFLQALFLIFLVVGCLDALGILRQRATWAAALAVSVAIYLLVSVPPESNFFSTNGSFRLLPFFLLGVGLNRYGLTDRPGRSGIIVATSALVLSFATRVLVVERLITLAPLQDKAIGALVAFSGIYLLVVGRRQLCSRSLAMVGGYSFGVYLLHVFSAAGSRILLDALGMSANWFAFICGMIAAVAFPIVVERLVEANKVLSWSIFGQRPRVH